MPVMSYLDLLKVMPPKRENAITVDQAVKLAWPDVPEGEALVFAHLKIGHMIGEKLVEKYARYGEFHLWLSKYGKQRLQERCR